MKPSARTGPKSKRKIFLKTPSRRGEVQPGWLTGGDDLGVWNDAVWRGRQPQELGDAALCIQATRRKSARAVSSQYFTCKGDRKKGGRSPTLLLRQGRRQTGPPSSECESQGSDARGRLLCSPVGGRHGRRQARASNRRHLFIFCRHNHERKEETKEKSISEQVVFLCLERTCPPTR